MCLEKERNTGNKDHVRVVVLVTGWLMVPLALIGSIGGRVTHLGGGTHWGVRKWELINSLGVPWILHSPKQQLRCPGRTWLYMTFSAVFFCSPKSKTKSTVAYLKISAH